MIKILNLTCKTNFLFLRHRFTFSSASDPYYILGVQKSTDFKDIKKAFYKLANEYHPDKNDSADARKKFLIVKQAFEQIKIQKGLMKPQNFVDSVSHDSVRPNADQFNPDEQQGFRSQRDYRIFREKASMDEKYSKFNSSFQTIHDINDIKIKVQEGEMKDASERLGLDSMKAKIMARSQSSMSVIIIGMLGIFGILAFINQSVEGAEENIQKEKIIQHSEIAKHSLIQTQIESKKRISEQKQKKLKQDELIKLINKNKENQKSKHQKSAVSQRVAWSKIIEDSKQQFVARNQRVL